jgi:serine/threonine protein phosphatase 1
MAVQTNWLKRLMGADRIRPQVPDGVCVYAIGDIHGRFDLTQSLLEKIWADAPHGRNVLIFLGDYVDRGPASKEVIDFLITLTRPGWEIVTLAGNHEVSVLEFLKNPEIYLAWRTYGGAETLMSYGVRPPMFSDPQEILLAHESFVTKFPNEHFEFLSALPTYYELGDYFFVHAGVRPGVPLEKQVTEDLLWIRDDFLVSDQSFGKMIVYGHTPAEKPVVRANRIGIDTGAYATNELTAVKLIGDGVSFLSTSDTQPPRFETI